MPATKKKTKPKTMLVRIHRPNKRLGYHRETFTLSGSGYPKFDYRRGWYEVDLATAIKLRRELNNPMDKGSKPVFEVVSREEAKAIEVAERQVKAEATAPIPLPQKIHKPTRAELAEVEAPETDEEMDLSDDDGDEDWNALVAPEDDEPAMEVQETASEDDLEDLDELVDPPKPVAKKVTKKATKKRATKKTAKKKTAKKTSGK